MKKLFIIAIIGFGFYQMEAQGLERTYNSTCDCYVVTNHYDGGQVSTIRHEKENGQLNGSEIVYYSDGSVQYERNWVNGKLNGIGKHYFRNGNLNYSETYDNGLKIGEWLFYDDGGDLIQTITYSGLNSDGIYKYYHAGVLYLEQTVSNGRMAEQIIHNDLIYNTLLEEAQTKNRK